MRTLLKFARSDLSHPAAVSNRSANITRTEVKRMVPRLVIEQRRISTHEAHVSQRGVTSHVGVRHHGCHPPSYSGYRHTDHHLRRFGV